jgi:flagellar hook-length control protein FliK
MEELLLLRELIEQKEYDRALEVVNELEEMSREDKLGKIYSYAVILLIHLIKQDAEKRSTRSWEFSIYNSSKEIKRVNKRKKSGGFYASEEELQEILTDAFDTALKKAALEAFEGIYTDIELKEKIEEDKIKLKALSLIC